MCPKSRSVSCEPSSDGPVRGRLHSARVISMICLSLLMFGANYAHLVSFYHSYNQKMGNSNLEYGLVLATYPLAQIFTGPFATKLSTWNVMSDKALLMVSLVVDAIFCMMPALLNVLNLQSRIFLALLILVRALQSVGGTTGSVLVYIINGVEVPHLTNVMIPVLETVYGAAVVVGPAVGAVLFQFLDFNAPFLALGCAEIVLAILTYFVLPPSSASSKGHESARFRKAARPSVILNILTTVNAFALITYNEATLMQQLKLFSLERWIAGLIFFFPAGLYAISSLFFGFQIKRFSDPRIIIVGGSLLSMISIIGLGPLMSVWHNLPLLLTCQAAFGLGLGPAFVCSYIHSVHVVGEGQDSKEALAIVTGLMEPSVAIGNLLGSIFAGWMLESFSYTAGMGVNFVLLTTIAALQAGLVLSERCMKRQQQQQADLTNSITSVSIGGNGVDASMSNGSKNVKSVT